MAIDRDLARILMQTAPEALIGYDTQRFAERLPDPGPIAQSGLLQLRLGNFTTNRRRTKREQLDGYRGWIAAAVNLISNDIRQNPWAFGTFTDAMRKDFEPIEASLVPQVMIRPQRFVTFGALLELTIKHLDTTGESFWHVVTSGADRELGEVDALQPIYPHWVQEPVFDESRRRFTGWRICPPGGTPSDISFDDVIWFYRPHPVEAWRAASPVEQVAATVDFDLYVKAYSADLMESGGIPPGILSLDQKIDPETADLIKARWRQTREEPEDISVLGNGAKYEVTGTKLGDLEYAGLARMNRDELLSIYGVGANKLGLTEDVNRSNGERIDLTYAKNVLRPRLGLIAEQINVFLVPRLGLPTGVEFRFDDPVPEDREFALKRANEGLEMGAITVAQYRMETGREPEDSDGTELDVYLIPNKVTIRENLEESDPPPQPSQPVSTPPAQAPSAGRQSEIIVVNPGSAQAVTEAIQKDGSAHVCQGDEQLHALIADLALEDLERRDIVEIVQAHGFLPEDLPLSKLDRENAGFRFALEQDRIERSLMSDLRARFSAEQRQVVKRVKELKTLPEVRVRAGVEMPERDYFEQLERGPTTELSMWLDILLPEMPTDEIVNHDLLDRVFGQQTRSWVRTIRSSVVNGISKGWDLFRRDVRRDMIDISTIMDSIRNEAQQTGEQQVRQIRSTTRRFIAEAARQASRDRLTVGALASLINDQYDRWKGARTNTIARTVSAGSINRGHELHAGQAEIRLNGFRVRNTWNAIFVNTREDHKDADGQRQFRGEKFDVGGEKLTRPLDPNGSGAQVINCNCFLTAELVRVRSED